MYISIIHLYLPTSIGVWAVPQLFSILFWGWVSLGCPEEAWTSGPPASAFYHVSFMLSLVTKILIAGKCLQWAYLKIGKCYKPELGYCFACCSHSRNWYTVLFQINLRLTLFTVSVNSTPKMRNYFFIVDTVVWFKEAAHITGIDLCSFTFVSLIKENWLLTFMPSVGQLSALH